MRKIIIGLILVTVVVGIAIAAMLVKKSVFGEQKESFTFIGTIHEADFRSLPDVTWIEVYHDGDAVVLAQIDKIEAGETKYKSGTKLALILKTIRSLEIQDLMGKSIASR